MIAKTNVKLNLGLNVLRRREDGYHDLESLFVPYHGYGDTLEVIGGDDYSRTSARLFAMYGAGGEVPTLAQAVSPDGKLMITVCRREGVDWSPLQDLCARAYSLLDKEYGLPPMKMYLEKTAPVGAGLGGGSADAAEALRMVSEVAGLGLVPETLAAFAARLGSDCPFFVYNTPMIAEGRGEILTPYSVSDLDNYDIQVCVPEGVSVRTSEAYGNIVPAVPEVPLREVLAMPVSEWKGLLKNDFETTVFALHPELALLKQSLYDSGAVYVSMSGSGSAVFALYRKA